MVLQIRDVPQEDTDIAGWGIWYALHALQLFLSIADGLNRHLGRGNAYCLGERKESSLRGEYLKGMFA